MEFVGIIQVPLHAFIYDPNLGRGKHPELVKKLSRVFRRTRCTPQKKRNHAEGLVGRETLITILSQLKITISDLRLTAKHASYPKVLLRRSILCMDGEQRITAAEKLFGPQYWWTVQLYYSPEAAYQQVLIAGIPHGQVCRRTRAFSHQTEYSDGDVYRYLRQDQLANRLRAAQELRMQLSPCKEKILNQLLKQQAPQGLEESIVDALDSLIPYPGVWEGLELGNWHRYLALHWPEPIIHFLRDHLRATYERIVDGVPHARQHFDVATVRCLALRCPRNKSDAVFIRRRMDSGEIFHGLTDADSRLRILENILSINTIIPSLKTLHENMKYFAIGAKILRQHVVPEEEEPDGQGLTLAQRLQWSRPDRPALEAGDGSLLPLPNLDLQLALKSLFLIAVRHFPYLSNDRPKQDVRGEVMAAGVDSGFVYLLQTQARLLGFSSPKIEKGVAGRQPVSRVPFDVPDRQVNSKWKCGKPGIRAFLQLQEHAFLPDLVLANGENGLLPLFVLRDFMDAFFGNDAFMVDAVDPRPGPETPQPLLEQTATNTDEVMADAGISVSTGKPRLKDAFRRNETYQRQPLHRRQPREAGSSSRTDTERSASPPASRSEPRLRRRSPIHLPQLETREITSATGATVPAAADSPELIASPVRAADRNAAGRSPVAPPGPEVQAPLHVGRPENTRPSEEPPRKFRPRRPPVRFSLDHTEPPPRGEKSSRGINKKSKKRKRTVKFSQADQAADLSLPSDAQPQILFAKDRIPVFESLAVSPPSQTAPASSTAAQKKRKAAHLETVPRLRDRMSSAARSDEPARKRPRPEHTFTSTSNIEPVILSQAGTRVDEPVLTTSGSQEDAADLASIVAEGRQRSPVAAPSSTSVTPPAPSGNLNTLPSLESTTHRKLQGNHVSQTQNNPGAAASIDHGPPAQAYHAEAGARGEIFHDIETFSETRTQSPGTYEIDDWLTLASPARSPVAAPESDL